MLLSIDWDAYSGCRELVFDAPIWGTPDREYDRAAAWQARALKRDPQAQDWSALNADFVLYDGWQALSQYVGCPTHLAWSHAEAWEWLKLQVGSAGDREVLNIDSHHDLHSLSGDPARVRPGNWAGLGLAAGLISHYTAQYPTWHADIPVTEGYDLERTQAELTGHLAPELLPRLNLQRSDTLPSKQRVEAVLLVQSPSWSSPAHDTALRHLARTLQAQPLSLLYQRRWQAEKR